MLKTSPFTVTPSTWLPSLSPPSPSLLSLLESSISTSTPSLSSSSPLSLNSRSSSSSSSSSSASFSISSTSEVRVSPLYLSSSMLYLTTCFLLFIGFRCNVLLTNIFIYPLLLALVFLKNCITFNKQISKFIMCYNFNWRFIYSFSIFPNSFHNIKVAILSTSFIVLWHTWSKQL